MVTRPGFSSPNQPDQEWTTAYRDSSGPDSRSDAHCASIVGDWEEPSGESRFSYLTEVRYDDFEAYRNHLIAADESRRPAVEAQEDELRAAFEEIAERRGDAFVFAQPARLNLLQPA